eukprot:TRINITY_DN23849_c0_g1_i1.p1 TRINITY_DN23849_c0_g1~~TRINITY_DN23849_c0_g1_i1.p1  ORF type:complete len:505 (+),score=111.56 TRINITY_DN23849_c0_g1_i1:84-1598(+)
MGEELDSQRKSSWMWRLTDIYDMLWKMVIRPPRDLYALDELGPEKFRLGKKIYIRQDLQLKSARGFLECSHFQPAKHTEAKRPCVVYLHGNCSSRLEAFDALPVLLPHDVTVFCLDLSGSGRSDGEYISLGFHEERDLQAALEHLRRQPNVSTIGLWGRSMGATTACLRAAEDTDLAACVLDSAFQDLKTVAEELVGKGRFPVPSFLTGWAFDMVRSEVLNRAGFDPMELSPVKSAPAAACPAFFGVASDDTFVLPHHTQALHDAWGGDRHLRVFDGGHNGVRPTWFLEEAAAFLAEELKLRDKGLHLQRSSTSDVQEQRVAVQDDLMRLEPQSLGSTAANPSSLGDEISQQTAADFQETLQQLLAVPQEEVVCKIENRPPAGQRDMGMPMLERVSERDIEVKPHIPAAGHHMISHPPDGEPRMGHDQRQVQSNGYAPKPKVEQPVSKPAPTELPNVIPKGLTLAEQLLFLGFDESLSEWASRRSLTLEAAVASLCTREALVQL